MYSNYKYKHECKWENVLKFNLDRKWWQEHYNIHFIVTTDTKQMATIQNNSQNNSYQFISIPN